MVGLQQFNIENPKKTNFHSKKDHDVALGLMPHRLTILNETRLSKSSRIQENKITCFGKVRHKIINFVKRLARFSVCH